MPENPKAPTWITDPLWRQRYEQWTATGLRHFHRYATWLVGLSWWRFSAYALALLFAVSILQDLPPFSWRVTEYVERTEPLEPPPKPPEPEETAEPEDTPEAEEKPDAPSEPASAAKGKKEFEISIGETGIRIGRKGEPEAGVRVSPEGVHIQAPGASEPALSIQLPAQVTEEIRRELERKAEEIQSQAEQAAERAREAEQARKEVARERQAWQKQYERELREWKRRQGEMVKRTRVVRSGDLLWNLAVLWVLFSAIVKGTYKGRKLLEEKAAAAEENAEAEALRRQLVEARLNTMQAQVEPHFLFNTLASIDHLIEVDPKRASQMQKNLIALLRASMPTMREASGQQSVRDLRRELAVVRPYLEILQVRMEERLSTEINVPDGLLSAEFPPMIIQGLVENAIKHGLEPKPEGGHLRVSAHIEHGKLVVEVADTGLGFGRADTRGTGVGLANTRERLQLQYGSRASLTVAENQPCGTVIRITVPYRSTEEGGTA
ncbi:MAG: histidine kinase [Burkholderiales bacterium]|uniref:sensor histidine kinase n=1 Tax=Inhella sp. TaxID=1921806 RepID=UPI001ACB0BA2|nr:histidine kinase [Burkholderiales bacterium]